MNRKILIIAPLCIAMAGCVTGPRRYALNAPTDLTPECLAAKERAGAYREDTAIRLIKGAAWGVVPVVGVVVSARASLAKREEKKRLNAAVDLACGTSAGD